MTNERNYKGELQYKEVPTDEEERILEYVLWKLWVLDPDWDMENNPNGYTDLKIVQPGDIGIEWIDYDNVRNMGSVLRFVIKKVRERGWPDFGLYGWITYTVDNECNYMVIVEDGEVAQSSIDTAMLINDTISVLDATEFIERKLDQLENENRILRYHIKDHIQARTNESQGG